MYYTELINKYGRTPHDERINHDLCMDAIDGCICSAFDKTKIINRLTEFPFFILENPAFSEWSSLLSTDGKLSAMILGGLNGFKTSRIDDVEDLIVASDLLSDLATERVLPLATIGTTHRFVGEDWRSPHFEYAFAALARDQKSKSLLEKAQIGTTLEELSAITDLLVGLSDKILPIDDIEQNSEKKKYMKSNLIFSFPKTLSQIIKTYKV
jgi:hypothetical protein